jgi:hypothetical protein
LLYTAFLGYNAKSNTNVNCYELEKIVEEKEHTISLNTIETNESSLTKYVIDALFANVLGVVDNYWSLKYEGALSIPTNVSVILRGGNKLEGSSVYDTIIVYDNLSSEIIHDAVPFYVCGIRICLFGRGRSQTIFYNLFTQNIMARSQTNNNKEKLEYSSLSQSNIIGIVSVCPYIINTLIAVKRC